MKIPPVAGPVIRVAIALFLCAACFQAGRWYQELSFPAHPGTEMVSATFRGEPEPAPKTAAEPAPLVHAGDPIGDGGDIITPLNVRDPSALVMGPGGSAYAPTQPPPPASPKAKMIAPEKIKRGRLLELLRKDDKKSAAPRDF